MTTINPNSGTDTGLPSLMDLADEITKAKDFVDLIHMAHAADCNATAQAAAHVSDLLSGVIGSISAMVKPAAQEVAK